MKNISKGKIRLWVTVLLLLGAVIPIVTYAVLIGQAPTVSQQEARQRLYGPNATAVLVDIRTPREFSHRHLNIAVNWPHDEILRHPTAKLVPDGLRGKQLLLICDSGIAAALAADRLKDKFDIDAYNVAGGLGAWIGAITDPAGEDARFIPPADGEGALFRTTPLWLQNIQVLSGFVIKPAYMIFALILLIRLRGRTAPDLTALRRAMGFFLVGELFCAFNYLFFDQLSHFTEFVHSYGMLGSLGFAAYALLTAVDHRIVHATDSKAPCIGLGICRQCIKHADATCGLRNILWVSIFVVFGVAAIPLTTELRMVSYNTHIYDLVYNYTHPVLYQIFEQKYCPVYAMVLLTAACVSLRWVPNRWVPKEKGLAMAKVCFAAAMGPLGFSFLRTTLFHLYDDNLVWMEFWEEGTELLFVAATGIVLWLFRASLFKQGTNS